MVFCGESIITEISVYVFFYMSEFIIQSTQKIFIKKGNGKCLTGVTLFGIIFKCSETDTIHAEVAQW